MSSASRRFLSCLLAAGLAWSTACAAPQRRLTRSTLAVVHGLQAFNHARYSEALQYFNEASRLRPGDGEVLFWRARAHLELGQLEEAVVFFEKSLRASNLKRPAEEIQTFLKTARDELDTRSAPPEGLIGEGKVFALPEWSGFPRTKVRFAAEAGSDSNPGLLPDEVDVSPTGRIGDSQAVAGVEVLAELYPLSNRDGPTLELSLEGRRSVHAEDSELDSSQARGLVQFAWGKYPLGYLTGPLGSVRVPSGTTPYSILWQLGTLYNERGGKRLYSASQGAFSMVCAGNRSAFQLDAAYQDFDFGHDFSFLDGSEIRLRISETFFSSRTRRPRLQYFRVGVGAGRRKASRDFENSSLESGVDFSFRVGRRQYLYFSATLRWTDFDHSNREETAWRTSAVFVRTLKDALHLTARASWGERDSNEPASDYDRLTTSVGLAWYFR